MSSETRNDVMKMKHWELKYWQKATRVVAMSEEDKTIMEVQVPSIVVEIVPNGVDSKYFMQKVSKKSQTPVILYVGNFTWLQNREAVDVLVRKVWPIIKGAFSKAKLWIIGKEAKVFFNNLESDDIRVDQVSDIRQVYQEASVLVAPIYGGGGTRYKNFEAFASGLPVITTSIGIGGTKARDGVEVIIRDNPDEIAEATLNLLKDKKLYNKIAVNARNMVKDKYDWDPIAKKLSNIYENLSK